MMVPGGNSENGSTGRSAHDDGYGTESGSNQKVHTVSKNSASNLYGYKKTFHFHFKAFLARSLLPHFFDSKDDLLLLP